jgi:RNA polymerase sigma-70 factor (ECF subfamily)
MPGPTPESDSELFAALRTGSTVALDELFRRHYVALCRTAVRLIQDRAAAEDIVQDTFASLWSKRSTLTTTPDAVGAYLGRAVRNRCLNYLRDRKRIPVDEGAAQPQVASASPSPAAVLEIQELQHRINQAIDRLPERCRLVFVMSRMEDMSHRQIAEDLNISTKTVENQMTRAYRFLRQWLAVLFWVIPHIYG